MFRKVVGLVLPGLLSMVAACKGPASDGPVGSGGAPTGSGGAGSTAGSGGYGSVAGSGGYTPWEPDGVGGFGGDWEAGWGGMGGSGDYEVIATADASSGAISGFALTDTHVYWLTYGSINPVTGRYNLDGALHRREIEGGEIETIAEDLEGPERVEVTSAEAYLWLTESTPATKHGGLYFGRMSVEGGDLEAVDTGDLHVGALRSFEDRAYFYQEFGYERGVFEHAPGEERRMVLENLGYYEIYDFAVDAAHIYYVDDELGGIIFKQPLEGGEPELLSESYAFSLELAADLSMLVSGRPENPEMFAIATMPASGGEWQSIAQLPWPQGSGASGPIVGGSRWLVTINDWDRETGESLCGVHVGSVEGGAVETLPEPLSSCDQWKLAGDNAFVVREGGLLRVPLD